MGDPAGLDRLVRRVVAQVRRRRAEHYGLRGAFYGGVLAALVLLAKGLVGPAALPAALALLVLGALAGVVFGLVLAAPRDDAARLADRAFGLEDRVATALEWAARPDRSPLVDALVGDAVAWIERLESLSAVRRLLPREARWLPLPLAAAVALALAPALPLPPNPAGPFARPTAQPAGADAASTLQGGDQTRPRPEPPRSASLADRNPDQPGPSAVYSGDRPALFKDTALTGEPPDFSSFLKKGDDRLKLLEEVDRLPDLKSDFTQNEYRALLDQSKALSAGQRPDQAQPQQLRDLLERMAQLGQKDGGEISKTAAEGLKALDRGRPDKAIDAMNRALDTMRQTDDRRRGALNLNGGKLSDRGRRSDESGQSQQPGDPQQEEPGGSKGKEPGTGTSQTPTGAPTPRLGARGVDAAIEGDPRQGKKDSIDTNLLGPAARVPSRLTTGSAFDRYRKMMEDAIAREEIPRDYQPQVKDYFRALSEK